jgi:hypothetical protein
MSAHEGVYWGRSYQGCGCGCGCSVLHRESIYRRMDGEDGEEDIWKEYIIIFFITNRFPGII